MIATLVPALAVEVAQRCGREIVGAHARRERVAVGRRMDARRKTILHRTRRLDDRRHRVAHRDDRTAENHRRLFRQRAVGELNGDLRIGLIVLHREVDRPALDAALLVDHLLDDLQRLQLRGAEERAAAGQRHDDRDFERIGRRRRAGSRARPGAIRAAARTAPARRKGRVGIGSASGRNAGYFANRMILCTMGKMPAQILRLGAMDLSRAAAQMLPEPHGAPRTMHPLTAAADPDPPRRGPASRPPFGGRTVTPRRLNFVPQYNDVDAVYVATPHQFFTPPTS